MTMRAIVSFAALLGLLGLTPRPSVAKSCEDLLVGNSYSCTVTSQGGITKSRAMRGPQTLCVSFDDLVPRDLVRDGRLTLSLGGTTQTVDCACGAKGRIRSPKFGEGTDVTCINPDGIVFMAKATKRGLRKGFAFNAQVLQNNSVFDCKLDPECAGTSGGCGLEGDTCAGSCPDGSTCVNTGTMDAPSCECAVTADTCEASATCDPAAYCPGVNDTCDTNADTGVCECAAPLQK